MKVTKIPNIVSFRCNIPQEARKETIRTERSKTLKLFHFPKVGWNYKDRLGNLRKLDVSQTSVKKKNKKTNKQTKQNTSSYFYEKNSRSKNVIVYR